MSHSTSAVLFVSLSLLLGVLCRSITKKIPGTIPYTVALLLMGIVWGIIDIHTDSELGDAANGVGDIDPHLFLQIFLPLLIFESAFSMQWHVFKRMLPQMLLLAVVGVVIASSLTAVLLQYVIEPSWSWENCFMLGAIVSATDPVAVVALLKELGGSVKLRALIEGESLLNDGTAIVIFAVFVDLSSGEHLTSGDVAISFLRLVFGGIALGLVWGLVTIWLIGLVHQDTLVETTLTVASTYLLFHVSEEFCHVSGVLAIVALGACFVWYGNMRISPRVHHSLHEFWGIMAYFGETLVFVLAGIIITQKVGFDQFEVADYGRLVLFYVILEAIRGVMVGVLSPLLRKFGYGFGFRRGIVLVHGGLRGAVSLAMALLVELEPRIDEKIRGKVMFYSAGITFLTLVVNAPTAGPLVRWLGLLRASRAEEEKFTVGVKVLKEDMQKEVDKMLQTATSDASVLCNWPQVQQFLALEKFIKPIVVPSRHSVSIEMSSTSESERHGSINDDNMSLVFPGDHNEEENLCCAGLRRGKIGYSQNELRIQQARLRFLRGTVEVYHSLSKQGRLTSDAVKALLDAEEAAEDKCYKPLAEWQDSLASVCRNPKWLTFLMKHSKVKVWSRVLSWGIRTSLSRGVTVANAYIEAHRQVIASAAFDHKTMEQLREESKLNTDLAKAFVEKASRKYKDLVTQIYTEQAANMLLYKMENNVSRLAGKGVFLDSETDQLKHFISSKQVELMQHKQTFTIPSERDIVVSSHLFQGVHEGVVNSLLLQHEEISLQKGEELFAVLTSNAVASIVADVDDDDEDEAVNSNRKNGVGMQHDFIYFLLTGAMEYVRPHVGLKQRVEQGTYINIAETLRGLPSAISYTALSTVKVLKFPGHILRNLIHQGCAGVDPVAGVDHLTANLVRLAATEILYLHGSIFSFSSSPHMQLMTSDSLRSFGGVGSIVKEAEVVVAHNSGNVFKVRNFALVILGEVQEYKTATNTSSSGSSQVHVVEGWQVCGPGVYSSIDPLSLVLSFAE